jgi:hypothetical protein
MALADTQRLRTAKVSAAADADRHTLANRCTFGNANPATHADSNPYYSPQDLGCHAIFNGITLSSKIQKHPGAATSLL